MEYNMSFQDAIELYRKIYKRFEKFEQKEWGINGTMIELSKQVGDLSKWVMIKEQYYVSEILKKDKVDDHIADELADILGQVIRIADYYGIDLVKAHQDARDNEDMYLKGLESK